MRRLDKTNVAIFAVVVVFLAFALGTLFQLLAAFRDERDGKIETIRAQFTAASLGMPDDLETLSFAEIEDLEQTLLAGNPYVRDLVVAKVVAGRGERFALPWDFAVVHDDWRERLASMVRYPLREDDVEYGALYFALDNTRLYIVYAAIASLALMLVLVFALVGRRLWVQEVALTRTTVELEERKRELVEMERFALAGQISANVFHDIRKPVLNIRMDVEEAQSADSDAKPPGERLADIRGQVDLFFSILRDSNIERFIRGDQTDREFVDVNDLLDRACALVRYEQRGVEVETDYDPSAPPILALPYRLIQVFSNIILNAYQAMGGQGRLRLSTRREGDWLTVRIADTGPGIDREHLERIFEPFFSTQQETGGSGLGLYISKGIVEDLGGTIEVGSEPDRGTTFEIRLPVTPEEAEV